MQPPQGVIVLGDETNLHSSVLRTTNQALGLAVFAVGIVLLVLVFSWGYQLYQGINAEMFGAKPALQTPQVPGTPPSRLPAAGAVKANPGNSTPLLPAIAVLISKMVALLVLGWLAAMLAARGAALALSTGKRE